MCGRLGVHRMENGDFEYNCKHGHIVYLYCKNCDQKGYELLGHYPDDYGIAAVPFPSPTDDHTFVCADCRGSIYVQGTVYDENANNRAWDGGNIKRRT